MIIVPGLPPLQETRHSRELSRRIDDAVRDYQRANPDTTEADVRTALLRSAPAGDAPDVVRRRRVAAIAVAVAAVGAFTATANAGGNFNRPTWLLISGIVAAVGAVAFVAIRWARRD
jgi:hypothetical protein